MAQIELVNWPTGEWTPANHSPVYDQAESQFMHALTFQENNRTANYRLGLVSMSRHEFQQAADYLEISFYLSPNHRGIKKTLGYCYTWLGKFPEAELILEDIPEAKAEMEVYIWWWQTQGRDDLAENASYMAKQLE
jgi:tetratricopeptide (TPR) repeat protein